MNIVGIIAEFNPMHNGHKYLIEEAKKLTNADYVIVIMSGSFTQQGNIAMFSKFDRANTAIQCGADLVLELPTVYATSSAENFAYGAIKILHDLKVVTHIAFGSECGNITVLQSIATKIKQNKDKLIASHKTFSGDSHAAAEAEALRTILTDKEYEEYSKPNNILGIEYLKALIKLNSPITPVTIHRTHSMHNDTLPSDNFCSSTYIRENLDNIQNLKKYVPAQTYSLLGNTKFATNSDIWEMLKYKIISSSSNDLAEIYSIKEGLQNRIKKYINSSSNLEDFLANLKCKKYIYSRLKRTLIHILLDIDSYLYDTICDVEYARILKVKKESKKILSLISNSDIYTISKINKNILIDLPEPVQHSLRLDITAAEIANTYYNSSVNDYTHSIIM